MQVVSGILALVPATLAVAFIRGGLREWRGGTGTPLSQRFGFLLDRGSRAALDRSGVVTGLLFAFFALLLADLAIVNFQHPVKAEAFVLLVAILGMLICAVLHVVILTFNQPKFLIPPRRRDEPGAFGARRRWREGRHELARQPDRTQR